MKDAVSLVVDIGGTNIRLGLVAAGGVPVKVAKYRCAEFTGLEQAIDQYLEDSGAPALSTAIVAVANPITGDIAKLTNSDWEFSISAVKRRYQLNEFKLINDFTALALSLPLLTADDLHVLYQPPTGDHPKDATKAVLGPGTGLGVSGLIRTNLSGPSAERTHGWQPLQGEGGHVTVAAANEREWEIVRHIAKELGHVSAERLLSGPGLVRLANTIAIVDGATCTAQKPHDVLSQGLSGECSVCAETLRLFCAQLGSCSADLALTLGAEGGVYIGGGIVTRMGDYLDSSEFVSRYLEKGRMGEWLRTMPVYVIKSDNPALLGAAQLIE